MTFAATNLESVMDRPAARPWTAEENASHAAGRAATVARAIARARAKQTGTFTLKSPHWIATFAIHGDTASVTHTSTIGRKAKGAVMTRAEARDEYARLIVAGYWR